MQTAVKALTIVSAIPVALYALWADYFEQYVANLAEREPKFDHGTEVFRVRLANLCAVLFQVMLFLGTASIRATYPIYTYLLFLATLTTQFAVQNHAERQIVRMASKATGKAAPIPPSFPARLLFWTMIGALSYLLVLFASVASFAAIGRAVGADSVGLAVLVIAGCVTGIIGGIALSFALAPLQIRKMFLTTPLADEALCREFRKGFETAGIARVPRFWVIEGDDGSTANAMIAGFRSGRGLFAPALFVSRDVIQRLTSAELGAVIRHEVSHLALHHLRRRFTLAAGMVVAANAVAAVLIPLLFFVSPRLPIREYASFLGLTIASLAFYLAFRKLGEQTRRQELEADIHAIERLGATVSDLASALRKLDRLQAGAKTLEGNGRPSTELRIQRLEKHFAATPKVAPAAANPDQSRAA